MEEEGKKFSLFFICRLFAKDFFFGPMNEDIPCFFIEAVFAGEDGADLLIGVVGIFFQNEDDLVFLCSGQFRWQAGQMGEAGGQRLPQMEQGW